MIFLSCPHNRHYQTVETPLEAPQTQAGSSEDGGCLRIDSCQRYKLGLPDDFITTEAENFHDLKLRAYYYYSIFGRAKLSDFSLTSLMIYCFIWVVVCDGWLAICLSVCIHLSISHSHLFRVFLMISSVYILCCAHTCVQAYRNSQFISAEEAEVAYRHEVQEWVREWNKNLVLFHLVFAASLRPSRTLCLPFTWPQAQSTESQAWPKALLNCTKKIADSHARIHTSKTCVHTPNTHPHAKDWIHCIFIQLIKKNCKVFVTHLSLWLPVYHKTADWLIFTFANCIHIIHSY